MRTRIVITLLLLALGVAAFAQAYPQPLASPRTITVSADAQRDVQPDTALISVSVESQGNTVSAAVADNNKTSNAVIAAVQALNFPNVQVSTTNFSVQPQYQQMPVPVPMPAPVWNVPGVVGGNPGAGGGVAEPGVAMPGLAGGTVDGGVMMPAPPPTVTAPGFPGQDMTNEAPQITGYQVVNSVEIRFTEGANSPLAATTGKLLDAAMGAGANRVDGVQFLLNDEKSAMVELVAVAARNAHDLANALATGSGCALGEVTSLQTGWSPVYASPMMPMATAGAGYASTPIEAGPVTLHATVTATYEIK